ncbi:amidohydrolase [Maricaulis maris MCS10]|uniref:Amidohydrolase n=1 Tax=Maricaulis maris (strain MCS10) TaxID=394221 RepID=Q0AP15_MARMM|nr:amidohydrolase family protein [Maricaulis maris]ABI65972.1 amidohydrolase [Maricaulis maris MCS10]
MTRFVAVLAATTMLTGMPAFAAQDAESEGWDVANPPLETRAIDINVTEGTWMSLDVSPDGQTIAFDMLGDIYTMPVSGGAATNVSSGLPWEIQPRFSPDGSQIAFTSDRAGGDNIWIMDVDGGNVRQLTEESFRLLNNAAWHPSGRYIAARKHFTTTRSAGTGEIWFYHVLGGGGVQLVERPNENFQKELGEPVFSPDGRYLYYTMNVTSGNSFIYAQDSNTNLFDIRRYDMETGETDTAVSGAGGAVRPAPSPDGRYMAFIRRDRIRSGLWIKDLDTGEERRLVETVDQDMQETWGVTGMYPNMDWMPDSGSLVYWADGGIQRVDIETGAVTNIPFSITDTRDVIDPPRPSVEVAPDTFQTRMPRFATASPDGSQIVYETLGQLWVRAADGGEPRRLTRDDGTRREMMPTWSADGRTIAFATWDDDALGSIRTISVRGGRERVLTSQPGHYRNPRFSPDGETVVFEKGSGGYLTAPEWSENEGVYRVAADGGDMVRVTDSGSDPHFGASNDRIFVTRGGGGARLVSIDLNGNQERTHVTGDLVTGYQVSPDGSHVAFRQNYDVFVQPLLPGPQSVSGGRGSSALPTVEISGNGGNYFHWSGAGDAVHWSMGPTFFTATVDEFRPDPSGEREYTPPTTGVDLSMAATADRPTGVVALTNARIITMAGEDGGVIESGTIIIDGNRIAAIGADVAVPDGARTVDMSGRTITPGFIDAHAHGPQGTGDIIPEQNWSVIAHLALGVTTIHDPSSRASMIFPASEYQRAGNLLAPRIYSTGEIVYGARAASVYAQIDNYEDAQEHVFRLASQGAHSIKNYNQPRREQRQQVVAAAIEAGVEVVAEGGSNYHMDMAMVADGNTSIEHNLPLSAIYEDVLQMYEQTEVAYTPTLVVTYGGLAGDPYWRQATDVWLHPILSQHVPPRILQAGTVRRTTAPEEDFVDDDSARTALLLRNRGVEVSIGAHGQQEGLAAHWEMWSFVRGGFTPLQALETATIAPARHLGFDSDLGSLEVGKLADLVVMTANPLDDIGNTDEIEYVMLNGRLYDAATMNETVTGDRQRQPYFWE